MPQKKRAKEDKKNQCLNLRGLPDVLKVRQCLSFDIGYCLFGVMDNTCKVYFGYGGKPDMRCATGADAKWRTYIDFLIGMLVIGDIDHLLALLKFILTRKGITARKDRKGCYVKR